MKKILALMLIAASLFTFVACIGKNSNSDLAKFEEYFEASVPTKSETTIKNSYSGNTFEGKIILTTGTVDGKAASKLESRVATLRDLEDLNLNPYKTSSENIWYLEGKGISENKGRKWDPEGENFAPVEGSISINLKAKNFEEINYDAEKETVTLTVAAENAKSVLEDLIEEDREFNYPVTITISAAGGRIASIEIEYVIESYVVGDIGSEVEVEDVKVTIKTNYSYDIQDITLN